MSMQRRAIALSLGLAALLSSCTEASISETSSKNAEKLSAPAPEMMSETISESTPEGAAPLTDSASNASGTTDRAPASNSSAIARSMPVYPEIGTLISAQSGDLACYTTVRDRQGREFQILATYEICDRQSQLLNQTVRFIYEDGNVPDCESAEPCGRTRRETLIADVVELGDSWQVLSNGTWTVTVGRIGSWDGVNNTGGLTYYGCDSAGNCLSLTDGFVVCRHGVCNMSWENGDYAYTLSSELREDHNDQTTLLVWQGATEILRAENMQLIEASDY
jgi:hypothetical protein